MCEWENERARKNKLNRKIEEASNILMCQWNWNKSRQWKEKWMLCDSKRFDKQKNWKKNIISVGNIHTHNIFQEKIKYEDFCKYNI